MTAGGNAAADDQQPGSTAYQLVAQGRGNLAAIAKRKRHVELASHGATCGAQFREVRLGGAAPSIVQAHRPTPLLRTSEACGVTDSSGLTS